MRCSKLSICILGSWFYVVSSGVTGSLKDERLGVEYRKCFEAFYQAPDECLSERAPILKDRFMALFLGFLPEEASVQATQSAVNSTLANIEKIESGFMAGEASWSEARKQICQYASGYVQAAKGVSDMYRAMDRGELSGLWDGVYRSLSENN